MPKAKKQVIKKLQKFPVRRLPVGKADGHDKEWQHELDVLDKKWQRLKKREMEREEKKKEGEEEGWIQVVADAED
jgi:phage terminase Nu1 subunit (DNA packaging protein)